VGRSYGPRASGVFAPSSDDEIPGWKPKADLHFVEMEYIGEEDNPEPMVGPSGRHYRFDKGENKKALVHPMDKNYLKLLRVAK